MTIPSFPDYDVLVSGHGNPRSGPYVEWVGEMTDKNQPILAENMDHVHAGPPSFGPRRKLGGRYLETEDQAKDRNARAAQYYTKATRKTAFYKKASPHKALGNVRTTLTFMGCSAGRGPFGRSMARILATELSVLIRMPVTNCEVSADENSIRLEPTLFPGMQYAPGDEWSSWWITEDGRDSTTKSDK